MVQAQSPEEIVDTIFTLLRNSAQSDYIGEMISQLEHALQAAQGARDDGADEETIVAALLHDIGHICVDISRDHMEQYGVVGHEAIGARFVLTNGFSTKIAELIRGHVQAKRYLTYKDPKYYAHLSHASKQTLCMQGGPMTAQEAAVFEQDPLFKEKLHMRYWDEQAKKRDWKVANLESYRMLLLKMLKSQ
jgi:phosphonate degradation associated HDIG domain protein